MNDLKNFNETFRKDVTYNIKRHKKAVLHPLSRKYIFRKTRERERENVNWPPSRSELRLPGKHPGKYLNHQSPGSVQIFECIIPSAACVRIRSSQWSCSFKKGVLWNFTKNTRKHRCYFLFFNKVAVRRPTTLLKKRLWRKCFAVNIVKFLRAPFLQNTFGWLLLENTLFLVRLCEQFLTFFVFLSTASS